MFIEYDSLENNWRALDDFYSYNQIESIRIVRSRKVPADLCVIEFLNPSGLLDGNDQNMRAARLFNIPNDEFNQGPAGETNDPAVQDTPAEQSISGFILQEGVTIQIKLGYNNDPDRLETVFIGQVVEATRSESSDRISVIAQSFATELVAKTKGRDTTEIMVPYKTTFDLLAHMMFEPEVLHFGRQTLNRRSWLGEDQSIQASEYIINSQTGPSWGTIFAYAGLVVGSTLLATPLGAIAVVGGFEGIRRGGNWLVDLFSNAITNTSIVPNTGPQDDNIYVPNEKALVDFSWLFDDGPITSEDYEFHLYQTTIWNVFQEMTLRHPGWIAQAVPYENSSRMTMFFGLPTQRYWAKADKGFDHTQIQKLVDSAFADNGFIRDPQALRQYFALVNQRFRPFRQYHVLTSSTDIISNEITATSHGVYNTVSVHYFDAGELDLEDSEVVINNGEGEIHPGGITVPDDEDNVITVKANTDLDDSLVREAFVSYVNCKGQPLARRYALSALTKFVKDMYKGSLIVLGNAKIKPYDLCYLSDIYSDIAGPIEVEEVVHTFSHQTGFITEIVPDAFVIANDMGTWWTYFSHKYFASKKISKYIGYGAPIIPESLITQEDKFRNRMQQQLDLPDVTSTLNSTPEENFSSAFSDLAGFSTASLGASVIARAASLPIVSGVFGAAAGATALSTGLWMIGDYLYYSWLKDRSAFFLCPLIKRGTPWTAGLPWTANTSFVTRIGRKIDRWFTESRQGIEEWHWAASNYREAIYDRFDGNPDLLTRLVLVVGETPIINTMTGFAAASNTGL
jgi:hypothetical protein